MREAQPAENHRRNFEKLQKALAVKINSSVARSRGIAHLLFTSWAGGWLSQQYYNVATVIIYKSQQGALFNVRTKGLREFKQGFVSYKNTKEF